MTADRFQQFWRVLLRCFGLLFFVVGTGLAISEYRFGQHAVSAVGTIVDVRVTESAEGQNYVPVIEYTTSRAEQVQFDGVSTSPAPVKNQAVRVLYNESNPQEARIDSFVQRWLFACIFTAIGTLMLLESWLERLFFVRGESDP
jgi:hypothetical protein